MIEMACPCIPFISTPAKSQLLARHRCWQCSRDERLGDSIFSPCDGYRFHLGIASVSPARNFRDQLSLDVVTEEIVRLRGEHKTGCLIALRRSGQTKFFPPHLLKCQVCRRCPDRPIPHLSSSSQLESTTIQHGPPLAIKETSRRAEVR